MFAVVRAAKPPWDVEMLVQIFQSNGEHLMVRNAIGKVLGLLRVSDTARNDYTNTFKTLLNALGTDKDTTEKLQSDSLETLRGFAINCSF